MFDGIVFFDLVVITIGIVGWALWFMQNHKIKLLRVEHKAELDRNLSVFQTETARLNAAVFVLRKMQGLLCSEPEVYETPGARQPITIGLDVADRLRSLGLEFRQLDIDSKFFGEVVDEAQAHYDAYRREKHVGYAQTHIDALKDGMSIDPDAEVRYIHSQLDVVGATLSDLRMHRDQPPTEEDLRSLVVENHRRIARELWQELEKGAVDMEAVRSHVAKIKAHALSGDFSMGEIASEAELAEAIRRCVMKSLIEPTIEAVPQPLAEA